MNKQGKKNNLKFEILFFAMSIILSLDNFKYNSNYKYLMIVFTMIFLLTKIGLYFLYNKYVKDDNIKKIGLVEKYNNFINITFAICMLFVLIGIFIVYFNNIDIKDKHQVTEIGITIVIFVLVVISALLARKILIKYIFKQDIAKTPEKYPVFLILNIFIGAIIFVILGIIVLLLLPYTGIKISQ